MNDSQIIRDSLMRNPCFAELDADYRSAILAAGRLRHIEADDCVFSQGEAVDGVYCLISGQLRAVRNFEDGRELLMAYRVRSGWFGEVSALDLKPRTFSMRAATAVSFFHINQSQFDALIGNDLGRARFFISELCDRIRMSYEFGSDALVLDGSQRLAKTLLVHCDNVRLANPNVQAPVLSLSQEDLSCMVGISRQRVNRILKEWQAQGYIDVARSKIELVNFPVLRAFASGAG